jgi:multidrug efflux pump subunit AcrA (membrane-fusion protein)
MQIIVDNEDGELMPGDYASIRLAVASAANVLSIPSSAIIFDAKGLSIATVTNDDKVVMKHVSIERDLGTVVEIAAGLSPTDRVIQNPPDGVTTGDIVRVVNPAPTAVARTRPKGKDDHG